MSLKFTYQLMHPMVTTDVTHHFSNQEDAVFCRLDALVEPYHPSAGCRIKRFVDICGAIVGLVLLAAIFLPVALAIYIDCPGPILYAQRR